MIDTVILSIPKEQMRQLESSGSRFFPEWTLQKSGRNHRIWIKNGRKQYKETDPYYPRLTRYNRQDERSGLIAKVVNIEFSVAKLLYNNNLNEIEEKDFPDVIRILREKLYAMGEVVSETDLANAPISAFDPAKNIVLNDGYTSFAVIRELGKINVSKKLELTKVTFKNDGQALQIYSKNYSIVFYDKIADLNQKKHRAVDKDQTPMQLSLFKEIKEKDPLLEVLRLEVRLRNKQKMNSVLKILGIKENPTFKDICTKDVCQKVVRWYWQTIIKGENLFLFELENNPKRLLRKILKKKTDLKAKESIYLVGLNLLCKDEGGIRELRQILEKRIKQRNWYRISDNIKELNEFTSKNGLHTWVRQIEECLEKFEPLKINSP